MGNEILIESTKVRVYLLYVFECVCFRCMYFTCVCVCICVVYVCFSLYMFFPCICPFQCGFVLFVSVLCICAFDYRQCLQASASRNRILDNTKVIVRCLAEVQIDSVSTYADLCVVNAIVEHRLPIVFILDIDNINTR